jgi:hypothetical protein
VAGTALFFAWLYREIAATRSAGSPTLLEPSVSLVVGLLLGVLGSYVVLRDLAARLRRGERLAGEAMVLAWCVTAVAGLGLSGFVTREPSDVAEWADLLQLTACASFLLGAAGLLLAFTVHRVHQDLDGLMNPARPQAKPEAAAKVAA